MHKQSVKNLKLSIEIECSTIYHDNKIWAANIYYAEQSKSLFNICKIKLISVDRSALMNLRKIMPTFAYSIPCISFVNYSIQR